MSLSRFLWAARIGAWLGCLPLRLRERPLPEFLERLGPVGEAIPRRDLDPRRIARIVARVSRLRIFDLPVFPRLCMRRALALYAVLARNGFPVEIHFGVRKDGPDLRGHSWITLDGAALGERHSARAFRTVYTYSETSRRSRSSDLGEFRPASIT